MASKSLSKSNSKTGLPISVYEQQLSSGPHLNLVFANFITTSRVACGPHIVSSDTPSLKLSCAPKLHKNMDPQKQFWQRRRTSWTPITVLYRSHKLALSNKHRKSENLQIFQILVDCNFTFPRHFYWDFLLRYFMNIKGNYKVEK